METRTELIEAVLVNGSTIHIEATAFGGEENVAFHVLSFEGVTAAIEGIASSIVETLQKVKPQRASVELGLGVALESGILTAVLLKGTGTANLKITLEWGDYPSE